MTDLLKQAVAKVEDLPQDEQDAIAMMILAELADDERWADSFARSQDLLRRFVRELDEERRTGKIQPFDPAAI